MMTTGLITRGCGPTADLCRLTPDHLSVMTDGRKRRAARIKKLFIDPSRLSPLWFGYIVDKACNILTIAWTFTSWPCVYGVVSELACRSEMLGPSLGIGGEIVAPR